MPVSESDVEVALGRDLTAAEQTRSARLVQLAQGMIEGAVPGLTFEAGTETVAIVPGDPTVIWTPKYPVRSITSIEVDDVAVPAADYRFSELGKIEPFRRGDYIINLPELGHDGEVEIAYAYGFTTIPDDLVLVVAAMVAGALRRGATNANDVESEQLGPYRVSYRDDGGAAGVMVLGEIPKRWRRTHRTVQLQR